MGIFSALFGGSPKAPDMTAAAQAQGAANKETALAQALLNNPNIIGPLGSQTWSGPLDASGRQTVTQTLSPAEQAKLDATGRIETGGLGILEQNLPGIASALSGPFGLAGAAKTDYDPRYAPTMRTPTDLSFAGAPGMPSADPRVLQQVEDAMYGQGAQYLDPQFKNIEGDMRVRLANQGIVPGTEAYNREMEQFGLQRQKAYGDLTQSAITGGQDAMAKLYGLAMQGRQQGVNEATTQGQFAQQGVGQQAQIASNQATLANAGRAQNYGEYSANRTMPLNMYNALLEGSQVNMPQFQPTSPTSIQPTPVMQGAIAQGQVNAANSSANAGLFGSAIGALGKIGAAAAPYVFGSDRRLKRNVERIGERYGLPWYRFEILGTQREGVMADEAERMYPAAVHTGPLGFKMVDYGALA